MFRRLVYHTYQLVQIHKQWYYCKIHKYTNIWLRERIEFYYVMKVINWSGQKIWRMSQNQTKASCKCTVRIRVTLMFQLWIVVLTNMIVTCKKGKTKPTVKLDSQFRDPPMMYAAGRWDCLKSSAVTRKGTPAGTRGKSQLLYKDCVARYKPFTC